MIRFDNLEHPISFEEFASKATAEWCLVRRDKINMFDLYVTGSVDGLLERGMNNPLTRGPLTETDVIQGETVLD